jgi:tagaturonate epimerase
MDLKIFPNSIVEKDGAIYSMVRAGTDKYLCVKGNIKGFQRASFAEGDAHFFPLTAVNAAQLRQRLSWLVPQPLPPKTSFGFGDRLGLATPGHIQAVRGSGIAPIFAQQSVRENARTRRSPQQVLDDAMWGVFQCGWREPWGADADHLKTTNDIASFVSAGYTFFTIDPGQHVDDAAHNDSLAILKRKVLALPWETLQDSFGDFRARYVNNSIQLNSLRIGFSEETILRAAAKYGRALAHAVEMYREIVQYLHKQTFDFEVSVDETETPTSIQEHYYIANELQRLNVRVTSLAPRFIGRFEKGVDYIGDLDALEANLAQHAEIARHFNYKLSLHSGSDKLSMYPLFASSTHGLAHVKTAGTSYLEALRIIAYVHPQLFREILTLALERYAVDRVTYHVSADITRVPASATLTESQLPNVLNEFDAREVLHVTFGSALTQFGNEIQATVRAHEREYAAALQTHFARHLGPFIKTA